MLTEVTVSSQTLWKPLNFISRPNGLKKKKKKKQHSSIVALQGLSLQSNHKDEFESKGLISGVFESRG